MTRIVAVLVFLCAIGMPANRADATAAMNTCNSSGECRAALVTVYSAGNQGFVVLAGHLIPTVCTAASWGYYWSLDLTDAAGRARYATLLSAYLTGQPVELRSLVSSCAVYSIGVGE